MFSTKEILSIALGKFNSVFWFDQGSKKAKFQSIPSPQEQVLQALLFKPCQTRVMEAGFPWNADSDIGEKIKNEPN